MSDDDRRYCKPRRVPEACAALRKREFSVSVCYFLVLYGKLKTPRFSLLLFPRWKGPKFEQEPNTGPHMLGGVSEIRRD